MTFSPEDFIQLLLAILIGGLIGAEREYQDKAAGFRTIMPIWLSSIAPVPALPGDTVSPPGASPCPQYQLCTNAIV